MRKHRKSRGIKKSDIGTVELRPRVSRHGRIQVGEAPRDFADDRPSPYVVRKRRVVTDKLTGELKIEYDERLANQEEVQAERLKVRRALAPTTSFGARNVAPSSKKSEPITKK